MRQPPKAILRIALLSALVPALAACGSSSPVKTGAAAKQAKARRQERRGGQRESVPARYTCDGQGISPPLEWGAVPPDVRQLALFLVGIRPKAGERRRTPRCPSNGAVAGLSPSLHRLAAGQLPAGGACRRRQLVDHRYTLCPAKGTTVHYQFELYGVPGLRWSTLPHFSGLSLLSPASRRRSGPHPRERPRRLRRDLQPRVAPADWTWP